MRCIERSRAAKREHYGFTLIEAIVVVVVMAILAAFLLPIVQPRKNRSRNGTFQCLNNQRQIGLAFRIWSSDHGEKFPWQLTVSKGGTVPDEGVVGRDFGSFPAAFLAISNELTVPRILICPRDPVKQRALTFDPGASNSFGGLSRSNPTSEHVSYGLGWGADEFRAQALLVTDPYLTGTEVGMGTVNHAEIRAVLAKNNAAGKVVLVTKPGWAQKPHEGKGALVLSDGSGHLVTQGELGEFFRKDAETMRDSGAAGGGIKVLPVRILVGH